MSGLEPVLVAAGVTVPVVIILLEQIKRVVVDTRAYTFIAVGLGIILNVLAGPTLGTSLPTSALAGIFSGLSASGLYSGVSTVREGNAAVKTNRTLPPSP